MEARKRSRPSILTKNGVTVPDDVIVDILSYLPVKSVLRFKWVCKSWLMITHQKYFIEKHKSRSQIVYIYEHEEEYASKYHHVHSLHSFVLERNYETNLHRIRNPATKQVLQVTSQVFEKSFKYIIGFDTSSSMYKLINFYFKEERGGNIGVRMLTIGSDDDHAWRYLDVNLLFNDERLPCFMTRKGVCYTATYDYSELEKTDILRFTMDGKSSTNIKVPKNFQSIPGYHPSFLLYMFILGDEKLALGYIIEHNLHVWVLENYEKHIWSEKKIISLNVFKDYPGNICVLPSPNLGKLRIVIGNIYVEYDVHSTTYICLAKVPPGRRFLYGIIPSLVSLKGMRLEDP